MRPQQSKKCEKSTVVRKRTAVFDWGRTPLQKVYVPNRVCRCPQSSNPLSPKATISQKGVEIRVKVVYNGGKW